MADDQHGELSAGDALEFRQCVQYEDGLFNTRNNTVLTFNGLGAVAVGLTLPAAARLCIAFVMITIDGLWALCAIEAASFIRALTREIESVPQSAPPAERFRAQWKKCHWRVPPTWLFARFLPPLLAVAWIVAVCFSVCS